MILLFSCLCLVTRAAYVRDVVKTLQENNLGPSVNTQQITIDFETCVGPRNESLVVDLTTKSGETLPVRITCEGLHLYWQSELIEIIPEQVEKSVVATCEADEVLSLLGSLVDESYKSTQNIEDTVRSLFQISTPSTPQDGRRRLQENAKSCLPAQGQEPLGDPSYEIPTDFRCSKNTFIQTQSYWENNITNRSDCDQNTLQWQLPKILQVDAHPLCANISSTDEVQSVPLQYRVAWMQNQFERNHAYEEKLGAFVFLENTFEGSTFSSTNDYTTTVVSSSELSERMRQLFSVGPYDKMRACFEAQALYAWPFVNTSTFGCEEYNVTVSSVTNETVVTCLKYYSWYNESEATTNNDWNNLFTNVDNVQTLEEFTVKYVQTLFGKMDVYNPLVDTKPEKVDLYPFEQALGDPNVVVFQPPVASKRHQKLRDQSEITLDTLHWQFDMPCLHGEENDFEWLRSHLQDGGESVGRGCDYFRLHVDDNRCKFDPSAPHTAGFPERGFCVPHFIYTNFQSQAWNSPECVAYDETEFFCGLANSEESQQANYKALGITEACTNTTNLGDLKIALHNSLIQMWDDTGETKYDLANEEEDIHAKFKTTFCENGEYPNHNTFDMRAYTNFSTQHVTPDAECPCAFADPEDLSGMRVCPVNPWFEFGKNMGLHQACVRHSGISSCMPIWSEQFARIPFEKRHEGVQDRCESQLWQNGYDGSRFGKKGPQNFNAPWSGDFEKNLILKELYEIIQLGGYKLNYNAFFLGNGVATEMHKGMRGVMEEHGYGHILSTYDYDMSEIFEVFMGDLDKSNYSNFCNSSLNFQYNYQEGLDGGTLKCRNSGVNKAGEVNKVCRGSRCDYYLINAIDNECLDIIQKTWYDDVDNISNFDYRDLKNPGGLIPGLDNIATMLSTETTIEQKANYHWMEPFLRFNEGMIHGSSIDRFEDFLYFKHEFKNNVGTTKHYWAVAKDTPAAYTSNGRFDIERVGRILRLYRCKKFKNNIDFLGKDAKPNPYRPQDQQLDQSWANCNPGNDDQWEPALSQNQKDLLTCYELKIRGFTRKQWEFRGKKSLQEKLAPHLEIESRSIRLIKRIEERYSKAVYGTIVDAILFLLKKGATDQSIKKAFYIPFANNTYNYTLSKAQSIQKHGGNVPIQRSDSDMKGKDHKNKQRKTYSSEGYYSSDGEIKCIPSYVVLEDYSSYRYNLHLVQKQNIQLGKQIEVWYSKFTSEENNALMNKAQDDLEALKQKTSDALKALDAVSEVDQYLVQEVEKNIGAYMGVADAYLEQMEDMSKTLELEREANSERLRTLDSLIADMNDNNTASVALLRATITQMEAAKDSLYDLAEGVVLTTSRTKEVVHQVENMIFRMRRGNQDYTRHARDVLETMSFRWKDENASTGGYHTRAGKKAYLPFVPRTPAAPAAFVNGALPAFKELAALPNSLQGSKGVLPVAVGRGWTLQHFNSHWHLVQHRVEFVCDAKSLLDSPDFLTFTTETWASLLGPANCHLEKTGLPRCNACKLRLLAHACPLGDTEQQRMQLERATIYNETFARLYMQQDLEDMDVTDRHTLLGCKQNAPVETMRTKKGLLSLEGTTWSRAQPLSRLETLSAYAEPSESLFKRYAQAYKDSYEPENETNFAVNPNALPGQPTIYNADTLEPVPAVELFRRENLVGLSIADRATWALASRELCLSPREWGFIDRTSGSLRGSARMVWSFSPGYDRSEVVLGSSMTMDGLLAINDWWNGWYSDLVSENSTTEITNAESIALEQLNESFAIWESLLCSQDFSASRAYSETWRNLKTILSLLSEAPAQKDYRHAGIPYFEEYPSWLAGTFGLKQFLGQRILEMIQILPYSRVFHELVAARTGRLPPEGITTEFFPRLHFPNVPDPVLESAHQEDSEVNENPQGEQEEIIANYMESRDREISYDFYERETYEHVSSTDEYQTTEPEILTNPREESAEFVDYEHTGGLRCYQSTWISTGRHGLPLYRWKLLPDKTSVKIHVEPVNSALPSSPAWQNILSGVKISSIRVPENILLPWKELYWLGNTTCSFKVDSPCPWPGKSSAIPFVYDIGPEQIQKSLAPGSKHSPLNALRWIVNQSNSYGPLAEKAAHGHTPPHLFRVPLFEEVREQKYAFPLDTTSLAENVFDASRPYTTPQQFFRPLIRSGEGLLHCVHLGDDVVANTNCRFLENMQYLSSQTTANLSSLGHREQHTFRSSALSAQTAPLGVSLEIPEDLEVRARLSFSKCPYDLRVVHLFSQKVALQAFFPVRGDFVVTVTAPNDQKCAGNSTWPVSQDNEFRVLPLPKGFCHLSKVVISLQGEQCLVWSLVEGTNITALADTPPPTATKMDFAYAVYANTQNREIVSLLADLVKADQAYSFLLQQNMLNYEDYQLRKSALGWVVEKEEPSDGLVILNSEEAKPYIEENIQKGSNSAQNAADKAAGLGSDPPTFLFDEDDCEVRIQEDLQNSGIQDTQSSVYKTSVEIRVLLDEILDKFDFYNTNVTNNQINWTNNFASNVEQVDSVLRNKVPSLFRHGGTPSEEQWECLVRMAELTQEELDEIYSLVQAAITQSNVVVVAQYGPPSALYIGTLLASFLGTLLLTAVPIAYMRLKSPSEFTRAICCCIKSKAPSRKAVCLLVWRLVIPFSVLLVVGLLCLLVFF